MIFQTIQKKKGRQQGRFFSQDLPILALKKASAIADFSISIIFNPKLKIQSINQNHYITFCKLSAFWHLNIVQNLIVYLNFLF